MLNKKIILFLTFSGLNASAMTLTIPSYPQDSVIPDVFSCSGTDISPQLLWSDVPSGTQSFAIIYNDELVNWLHWKHYNIDSAIRHMPEDNPNNVGTGGLNDFGHSLYGGPCPPSINNGIYRITLYALNTVFASEPSVAQIQAAAIESSDWLAFRNVNSMQDRYEYMATYRLTFHAQWSNTSHPINFPSGAHFSPLIGNTHNSSGNIWQPAQIATDGIESMAEAGATNQLSNEITDLMNTGSGENLVTSSGSNAIDTVVLEFDISNSHPLFSMVSMIAPSPDWFIGVHDLNLSENGVWLNNYVIDLFAYDAGTDSGSTYTSANSDTNPQDSIAQISTGALGNGMPLGSFEFELLSTQGIGPIDIIFSNGFE